MAEESAAEWRGVDGDVYGCAAIAVLRRRRGAAEFLVGAEPAGWAGTGGIRGGDLIQRIENDDIKDLDGYRKVMERIGKEQPKRVVMVVLRGVRTYFQFIEPDWKPVAEGARGKDD